MPAHFAIHILIVHFHSKMPEFPSWTILYEAMQNKYLKSLPQMSGQPIEVFPLTYKIIPILSSFSTLCILGHIQSQWKTCIEAQMRKKLKNSSLMQQTVERECGRFVLSDLHDPVNNYCRASYVSYLVYLEKMTSILQV